MKGRSPQRGHSAIVFLRRLFIAAMLVVSLLSAPIPFATASSVHFCTMECCAGKAPHEAGACNSGLMKSTRPVVHEPEVLCGLHGGIAIHLTATRQVPWEIIEAGAEDGEASHARSCGGHHAESTDQRASSGTKRSKATGSLSIQAPSIANPCSSDCGTCSGGYVRQPRPREQTTVAWGTRARPPSSSHFLRGFSGQTATLRGHYEQPPPRGPPTPLS
jgi:hypothetical protein